MSDHLETKALEVVDNKKPDMELSRIIREEYNISSKRQIAFVIEYVKNSGNATNAYRTIYGSHINKGSAAVLGHKILKKLDIGILLEYMGHGIDALKEAMDLLKVNDTANYMKYSAMFRNWDKQKIEHSGYINIPNITIVTTDEEEEDLNA